MRAYARAALALVALPVLLAAGPSETAERATTAGHPRIQVERARLVPSAGPMHLRVFVRNPDRIRSVTAWVRGERDRSFNAYNLSPHAEAGRYSAQIPAWSSRGDSVTYFVEVQDRSNPRPSRLGSPEAPLRLEGRTAEFASLQHRSLATLWQLWVAAALAVFVLVSACKVLGRRRTDSDLEFWWRLVGPLSDKGGLELERAIERLASKSHVHPTLGRIRPTRQELMGWIALVRQSEPARIQRMRQSGRETLQGGAPSTPRAKAFHSWWWFTHGRPRAQRTIVNPPQGSPRAQGVTLVEMLVVVALLGLAVGAALLYFKPMEAPVRTGAELVEGLVRQARASAMSTTTAHRVRPFSEDRLVVERAHGCHAEAWTVDPRQDLELPRDVSLASTDWSVCFNSRGITESNVIVTLEHPRYEARSLEILLGGAVRWVE